MKLGVCYYPEQWPRTKWADDARRMAELGIRVVRIAEFAWSRMEPSPGRYDWEWLDEAVRTLADAGLEIVLGTPTAAPPRWLIDQHPDILPVAADGQIKNFGSRRHYCFSNEAFFEASRRIVTAMAERYGQHPAVIAWQTDNEYGCHDTILSYSEASRRRFQLWLAKRYETVEALNRAWGNVFWSMEYSDFAQIGLPNSLPTLANPIHMLDFRRFSSDELRRYNWMQVEILRAHSPGRDVLHNFMGFFGEFDHHEVARDLDVASWDNYPLGATNTVRFIPEADRLKWMRSGHPDIAAFHHDLYRGMCKGRFWIMEQEAGPVNWAEANPSPLSGMVRTWTWEAFAHGAEVVSYFRWRQVPYAQEQLHSALNTPDDRLDLGGEEAARVAAEMAGIEADPVGQAKVALLFDYRSKWITEIQPNGAHFDFYGQVFGYYSALRQLGFDIDIVPPDADLTGYSLIVAPLLSIIGEELVERLGKSGAQIVFGPRCGAKTEDFAIPEGLPPGPLTRLLPIRVTRVESLPPEATVAVQREGAKAGETRLWRDFVAPGEGVVVEARFEDSHPAVLSRGPLRYFAGSFDAELLKSELARAAAAAGLTATPVTQGLRLRRRGRLQFAINYGPDAVRVPAPAGSRFALGGEELTPANVAAWFLPENRDVD
ncbi:beta-galactosidase [Niveibacterium terrae]|uniref:beta-galactosidase n=1 Tax=Niveibacterium terrae TaxID=3373598 RepID=UPI003A93D6CC